MRSPYTKYQGGGSVLPAGYLEAAMRPGQALAAGIREASEGIAEGLQKYAENKEQSAFLDQRLENLKPYMDKMLEDEDWTAMNGKKMGLDLDKFSKAGLSSKKAMMADFEFLIKRYDKDREFRQTASKYASDLAHKNETLKLSKETGERAKEKLKFELEAPGRKAAEDLQERKRGEAGAGRLSEAIAGVSEMMGVKGADVDSAINVARGSLKSADNIKQFNTTIAAMRKAEADAEKAAKEWNLPEGAAPVPAIPGQEWPKLINTSQGQKQLIHSNETTSDITSPDVQKDLATIIGPEAGYKTWLDNNPQHATEAIKIRRAFNLSTEEPAKPAQSLITGRLKLKAELRQLQAAVTATPNAVLDRLISAKQAEIADYDTAINQAGTAPSTGAPAAGGASSPRRYNPATGRYE